MLDNFETKLSLGENEAADIMALLKSAFFLHMRKQPTEKQVSIKKHYVDYSFCAIKYLR